MSNEDVSYSPCSKCKSYLDCIIPDPPASPILEGPFYTSRPLTVAEGANLRDAVASAMRNRNSLKASVVQLERLLERCKESLTVHDRFIDQHRPVLSSVRRLPMEIWGEVFEWATSLQPRGPKSNVFTPAYKRASPFNISQVCREWRKIAIRRSSLWCNIIFRIDDELPPSKTALMSLWLSRSGRNLLNICVRQASSASTAPDIAVAVKNVLNIVETQSSRWGSIELTLNKDLITTNFSSAFPPTPRLKSIRLWSNQQLTDQSLELQILGPSPKLCSYSVDNVCLSAANTMRMLTWSTLQCINFGPYKDGRSDDSAIVILNILEACPQLIELCAACHDEEVITRTAPLHHPNLIKLTLNCPSSTILDALHLPSLKELKLSDEETGTLPPEPVSSFVTRCPNLKALDIESSGLGFIRQIARPNKIAHFDFAISVRPDVSTALDDISVLRDLVDIFPNLEVLRMFLDFDNSIEAVHPSILVKDAFIDLVQWPTSSLREIKLDVAYYSDLLAMVLEPLHHLKELNLDKMEVKFILLEWNGTDFD